MKTCCKCNNTKEFSLFALNKSTKDGYAKWCKDCFSEYRKSNKEKIALQNFNYYEKNKESCSQKSKEYRKNNFNRISEYKAQWKKNNKDKVAVQRHKRRVPSLLNEFDEFVWREAHCLSTLRSEIIKGVWHIDHIVPINHKQACGLNNGFNLQVVPAVWNMQKGNRNMNKFIGY
jgi:hypothetical protein